MLPSKPSNSGEENGLKDNGNHGKCVKRHGSFLTLAVWSLQGVGPLRRTALAALEVDSTFPISVYQTLG